MPWLMVSVTALGLISFPVGHACMLTSESPWQVLFASPCVFCECVYDYALVLSEWLVTYFQLVLFPIGKQMLLISLLHATLLHACSTLWIWVIPCMHVLVEGSLVCYIALSLLSVVDWSLVQPDVRSISSVGSSTSLMTHQTKMQDNSQRVRLSCHLNFYWEC